MGKKNHITNLKIEKFKKFKSLELNDIGHFNLIVGDNNVGKTSLLESLLVHKDPLGTLSYLTYSMDRLIDVKRAHTCVYLKDYYLKYGNNNFTATFDDVEINIAFIKYKELERNKRKDYLNNLKINNSTKDIFKFIINEPNKEPLTEIFSTCLAENMFYDQDVEEGTDHSSGYSPYIPTNYYNPHSLANIFSEYVLGLGTKEEQFIKSVKVMIESIDRIYLKALNNDARNNHLYVRRKGEEKGKLLVSYGDGAVKIFQIVLDIFLAKGSKLMIDEIDTGIHYSRFKAFWKVILRAAMDNQVQLFCTTHNLEAIQFYKEAIMELGEEFKDQTRLFQLKNYEDGITKAYNYNFEKINHYLETENELRGGQLQVF